MRRSAPAARVALVLSLALHAAVLALVARPASWRPPPDQPVVVELWAPPEAPPPAAAPAAPRLAARSAPGAAGSAQPSQVPVAPPAPAPLTARAPVPLMGPGPAPVPAPETGPAAAWFAAHGLPGSSGGAADLRPRLPGGAGPGPGAAGAGAAAGDGAPDPRARVAAIVGEAAGQARIRGGMDASWWPVQEALTAAFHPGKEVLEGDGTRSGAAELLNAQTWAIYREKARRWGEGAPVSDQDGADGERHSEAGRVKDRLAWAGGQGNAEGGLASDRLQVPLQRELAAVVEVVRRRDGSYAPPRLRATSGLRELDRSALDSARLAAAALGPATAPVAAQRSVWAFVLRLGVVPPVPVASCPPDVLWRGELARCAWPLKRLSWARVELLALEDG